MILIAPNGGDAVFSDLVEIVRCDPNLDWVPYTDVDYTEYYLVTYFGPTKLASQTFLLNLVNDPTKIIIYGVDDQFITVDKDKSEQDPNKYKQITKVGGGTTEGPATTADPYIRIWVDMTDAGGLGYWQTDLSHDKTTNQHPITLYHELTHAEGWITGFNVGRDDIDTQQYAVAGENIFRAEIGAKQVDWRGPGGVGESDGRPFISCQKGTLTALEEALGCVVATAATGSPHSVTVTKFQQAIRDYGHLSRWVTLVADHVFLLYERFGPLIVREMQCDSAFRTAVLLYAVQPTVHFLELVELYIAGATDNPDLIASLNRCINEYLSEIADAKGSKAALRAAADGAAVAGRRLWPDHATLAAQPSLGQLSDNLFAYLTSTISASGLDTAGFAWGLEGLAFFLRHSAEKFANNTDLDADSLSELDAWLARFPIPADADLRISDAPEELRALSERVFTGVSTRELFAQRLVARWPADSAPALNSLLDNLGYTGLSRPTES